MPLWETPDGMPPGLMVSLHPGDDRIHHIATLRYGVSKGDFTPEYVPQDIEVSVTLFGQAWEQINHVLGIDHPGPVGSRKRPPAADIRQRAAGIEAG